MATATKKRTDPASLGLIPVDEPRPQQRKKPGQKKPGDPFADITPESLGLIPLGDDTPDPPPANDDFSPEALGLVPADQPEAEPAPAEEPEPEPYTWDWAAHKAQQFIETVGGALLGDSPPANADMSRVAKYGDEPGERPPEPPVPPDKLFAPGSLGDNLVPDVLERPARGIYDWATSDNVSRDLRAGGAAASAGLMRISGNAVGLVNYINDFLVEQTGIGVKSDKAQITPFDDTTWGELEANLGQARSDYERWYGAARVPEGERTTIDALVEAVPQLPAMIAEYGAAAALMGPIAGFAAVDALMHADEGVEAAAYAGMKGAAMGAFFEWTNILSRPLRIPALAAAGGGVTALEGGSDADIAAQAILFPVLGLPARGGPVGVRYLREHGITPDLRDLGGHARDLLLGGNVRRSETDMNDAAGALKTVRDRHEQERQQEVARHTMEESEAKVLKEGETQADVNERLSHLQEAHRRNLEELAKRHEKEEQPLRHLFEMAERRHQRALHPFSMPWQAAPHMRAVHSAERGIIVEHTRGYEQIQQARREADERFKSLQDEANEFRRRADEGPPEQRERANRLADELEMEGARLRYEMVRRVEEEIEARLFRAEQAAERARDAFVAAISAHNKIEGRRAAWLANYRTMQDAYRTGIRVVRRGEERARALLDMGNRHVGTVKKQLRERGITEENVATKPEYDAAMRRAEEVRDAYKELASLELLDAQYRADSRVSHAQRKFDMAVEAARLAGVSPERLPRRRAAKDEEVTSPEDAKKRSEEDGWDLPDSEEGRRGADYETAYRKALEGMRDDPLLGEMAKEIDPLIARIHDPADVLPAIARIARQLGHEPASTRGKQTAAKREILAERLGMSEKEFLESPYGKAFSDYEIEAAIMLLDRSWARLQDAYRAWKNNPGSEIAATRARLELIRFLMIRNRLRGAAAEAGRSLRMFRELKKKYGSITEPMTDAEFDSVMSFDKPGNAGRRAEKILRGDWFRGVMDWWINGLLSSLQTDFVNIYSGIGMALMRPMKSTIAAGIGLTRWAVWNGVLRPLLKPFIAAYRAAAKTGMFGAKEAERAFARSDRFSRPSEFINFDRVRFGETLARLRGYIEALPQAFAQFIKTWWRGERYLNETNFGYKTTRLFDNPLAPGRRLSAIDDFFKVLFYRAGIRAHAYRKAIAESQNLPVSTPKEFVAYRLRVRQRYRELVKRPSGDITSAARQEALEGTFQNEPNLLKGSGELIERNPALKYLVPFRRVLLSNIELILTGTPAAVLFKKARMDLAGYNGRIKQDEAWAHIVQVTGGATIIFLWALDGGVTDASDKPGSRTINSLDGTPPLSVRIPYTDKYVSLNRIDPVGAVVALGAAAARAYKQATVVGDEDAQNKAYGALINAVFGMVTQRAGMQGLIDFIEAFQGGSYGNEHESATAWVNNLIATLTVPQAVAVDARTVDPYLRYSRTLLEKLQQRTRWRSDLYPVRNAWGDPIKAYANYDKGRQYVIGNSFYDVDYWLNVTQPFYWGQRSNDPATKGVRLLYELYGWHPGMVKREIDGRRLNDDEFDFYAKRAGNLQYAAMTSIVKSDEWGAAQAAEDRLKAHRAQKPSLYNSANDPSVRRRYREWEAKERALAEDLRKRRYALYLRTKNAFAAARKQARQDTRARYPGIMERGKRRDPSKNPGETPGWLDGMFSFMHAEGDQEEWDAEDELDAEGQ